MPLSIVCGHADKPPPRSSKINPDVSPAVEAFLLKALAKKREASIQVFSSFVHRKGVIEISEYEDLKWPKRLRYSSAIREDTRNATLLNGC